MIDTLLNTISELLVKMKLPSVEIIDLIEITILTIVSYNIVKALKNTRAWVVMKGLSVIVIVYIAAYLLNFKVTIIIFQSILMFIIIGTLIIMQPELRRILEKIGTNKFKTTTKDIIKHIKNIRKQETQVKRYSDDTITEVIKACYKLGAVRTGALIIIENDIPLDEYIETGEIINSDIKSSLIINIFEVNTPLHDGAIILRGDKIISASSYLPLINSNGVSKDLGTRHRAAIGITEITDCIAIVVSEETGNISYCYNADLQRNIGRDKLTDKLKEKQIKEGLNIRKKRNRNKSDIITNNLGLKITSFVIVLMLWGITINTVDPVIEKQFSGVPITVINEQIINNMKLTYSIDGSDTISVIAKDRKSKIDTLNKEDITIEADLKELSITNSVALKAKINSSNTEVIMSANSVNIIVEELVTKEIGVELQVIDGNTDDYFINNISISPKNIKISGARSVINKIDTVVAKVRRHNLKDENIKSSVEVLDKNGEEVINNITLNESTVIINAELLETKEVSLDIDLRYENETISKLVDNVKYNNKILVAATDEVLETVDILHLNIPIDITFEDIKKPEFIKSIDISEFIVNSKLLIPSKYERMQLLITFKDLEGIVLTLEKDDIQLRGTSKLYNYNIKELLDIQGMGLKGSLDNTESYIDVYGLGEGIHELKLITISREGKAIYTDTSVKVEITQK